MVDTSDRRRIAIGVLVIALVAGAGMGYLVAGRGDDADPSVGTEVPAVDDGEDRSSPGPRLELLDGLRPRPSCPIGTEPVEPGPGEVLLEVGRAQDGCFVWATEVVAESDADRRLAELRSERDVIAADRAMSMTPTRHATAPDTGQTGRPRRTGRAWRRRGPEDRQWGHDVLDAAKMRALWPADAPEVKVAVLDDEIDVRNLDLAGQVSDVSPWKGTADWEDHGTPVASIIAATDDGKGVLGLVPRARLMDARHNFTAVPPTWAVDNGADVINVSMQGADRSDAWLAFLAYAERSGVVVVVGAGNCGDPGQLKENDCKLGLNEVNTLASEPALSVGAVEHDGNISKFSTRNATVDLVAPGGKMQASRPYRCIISTGTGCEPRPRPTTTFSGTSAAAPHVAAAAALLKARQPGASPADIREALMRSARPFPDQDYGRRDDAVGYGVVDPCAAAAYLERTAPSAPGFECRKDPDDAPDRPPSGEWPTVPSPSSTSVASIPPTPQSSTTSPSTPPSSDTSPPPASPTPASLDLSAAPVPSLCGQPAGRLVDGELPKPINNGFVALEQPLTVTGDVLGDTAPEAVGVIACSAGGVGWPNTIHIYGPGPKHLVQIDLTDHYNADGLVAIVESVEITDRTLVVRWVTDGPDDPISDPSITVEGRFTIQGGKVTADVTELEGSVPTTAAPTTAPPTTGNGSPATTEAAAARLQQWIRAVGADDAGTYCEIAAPALEAQGLPRDKCPEVFPVLQTENSPEDLAALAGATVDAGQAVEVAPGRVEIPNRAITYPAPISENAPPEEIFVMVHDGTDWYVVEYPHE